MFTGSCHTSLAVVSSNVFGLEFFDCGLTDYELQKLSSFKIYTSVLLENVPQLIFTAIYWSEVGMSINVTFSSLASLLSVFAVVLSFCIDRDLRDMDIIAAEYYLALESNHSDGITDTVEKKVLYYSGFRDRLGRQLAQLWRVSHKNIQIGKTILTTNGAITHILHFMKSDDLADYAAEFCSEDDRSAASTMWVIRQFCNLRQSDLNDIFREHFRVGSDFEVVFYDQRDKRKRTLTVGSSHDEESNLLVAWERSSNKSGIEMMGTGMDYMLLEDK